MEEDDEVCCIDPEKPGTSKATSKENSPPAWPSKDIIKDLKSSPKKKRGRPPAVGGKKPANAAIDKEKGTKTKQQRGPATTTTTQANDKAIQASFAHECMTISKGLEQNLAGEEHNLVGIKFTPEVVARAAQIARTVLETKWGPDLAAFSNHARRATITGDDVRLLFHKKPSLLAKIVDYSGPQEFVVPASTTPRRQSPTFLGSNGVALKVNPGKKAPFSKSVDLGARENVIHATPKIPELSSRTDRLADALVVEDVSRLKMPDNFFVLSRSASKNQVVVEVNGGGKDDKNSLYDDDERDERDSIDILLESDNDEQPKPKRQNTTKKTQGKELQWLSKDQSRTQRIQTNDVPLAENVSSAEKLLAKADSALRSMRNFEKSTSGGEKKKDDIDDNSDKDSFYDDALDGKDVPGEVDEIVLGSDTDSKTGQENYQDTALIYSFEYQDKHPLGMDTSQPLNRNLQARRSSGGSIPSAASKSSKRSSGKDVPLGEIVLGAGVNNKASWNPFRPQRITPPTGSVVKKRLPDSENKETLEDDNSDANSLYNDDDFQL